MPSNVRVRLPYLTAALIASAGLALAQWGPTLNMTVSPDNSNLPTTGRALAVSGSNVHVVYADKDGANLVVFYQRSTDRGGSWQEPVVIETSPESYAFSVAADDAGNVVVVNRRTGASLWWRHSSDHGATWSTAAQLLSATSTPVLVAGGAGRFYLFDQTASDRPVAIQLHRSTDGGASWQNPISVATPTGAAGLCAAALGQRLNVIWSYGLQGQNQIYGTYSTDGGGNWSSAAQISSVVGSLSAGVWPDNTTGLHLAFAQNSGTQNYRRSTDGGATWLATQTLPVQILSLTAGSNNELNAVGLRDNNRVLFFRSANSGAIWGDTLNISGPDAGTRSKPFLCADDENNLHAVWNSRQTGNVEVFYRKGARLAGIESPGVAPNPVVTVIRPSIARNRVTVDLAGGCRLYDRRGALVASLAAGKNDISALAAGVYFARDDAGRQIGRLVRTH